MIEQAKQAMCETVNVSLTLPLSFVLDILVCDFGIRITLWVAVPPTPLPVTLRDSESLMVGKGKPPRAPELVICLSRHGTGEGYRTDEGIHMIELLLPLPSQLTPLLSSFTGLEMSTHSPPGLILKDTCGHHCLPTASFRMTMDGRFPKRYRFCTYKRSAPKT